MKILVIRRDNIGDLVCTTPLFSALRHHFPQAHIAALVNSYNAPVLCGNRDIDELCVYHKAKHRAAGESSLNIWWRTLRLIKRLRGEKFDIAIVATPGRQPAALKFARWVRAKRMIAYGEATDGIDDTLQASLAFEDHETEAVMRLLQPLGINEPPGPVRVFADTQLAAEISLPTGTGPLIALHISARKSTQRWPIKHFSELAHALHTNCGARFLLFWSPGTKDNAQHPGDDDKAKQLIELCRDLPFQACPTHRLEELIAGISNCDKVICSDGGAMHLAAGLGKPIICFFGNSSVQRWHPWGVPHQLIHPESDNVADVSTADALAAFNRLPPLPLSTQK